MKAARFHGSNDIREQVLELAGGIGADLGFECAGVNAVFETLLDSAYVRDQEATIRLVQDGVVDLKPFITGRIALDDLVSEGLTTLIDHNDTAVKILVHT